jgi:hypothetical protein
MGPAPSIFAASFCSWSSDWIAVKRIRNANGSHCHATIRMTANNGYSANQSIGVMPIERIAMATRPYTGCRIMFFQISALTVGITKNGAIANRRATPMPTNLRSNSTAISTPPTTVISSTATISSMVCAIEGRNEGSVARNL